MKLFKDSVSREILLLHFTKKFIFYSFFCDTLFKKIFGGIAYESSQPASGHCRLVFAVHSVQVRGCLACCTLSGVCSSAALLCQLVEVNRPAQSPDAAAILDTAHARVVCAAVLLALFTVLNAVALIRSRSQLTCNHC